MFKAQGVRVFCANRTPSGKLAGKSHGKNRCSSAGVTASPDILKYPQMPYLISLAYNSAGFKKICIFNIYIYQIVLTNKGVDEYAFRNLQSGLSIVLFRLYMYI